MKLFSEFSPQKIIAVGLNYKDHAAELNMKEPDEPLIFMKPPTAVIKNNAYIKLPECSIQVDYEGELAIVIKKICKNINEDDAPEYIWGYTCANDITARDLQKKDGQWTRAKSFDTFCPLGPHIETDLNPDNLKIKTYLNGVLKQNSSTANFIFKVNHIVGFVSNIMTLLPGDIILTGTPFGVGKLSKGDKIIVEIEKIGALENYVE